MVASRSWWATSETAWVCLRSQSWLTTSLGSSNRASVAVVRPWMSTSHARLRPTREPSRPWVGSWRPMVKILWDGRALWHDQVREQIHGEVQRLSLLHPHRQEYQTRSPRPQRNRTQPTHGSSLKSEPIWLVVRELARPMVGITVDWACGWSGRLGDGRPWDPPGHDPRLVSP